MTTSSSGGSPIIPDTDVSKLANPHVFSSAIKTALNRSLIILGAAAAVALAGASASGIAAFTGTGYTGPGSCAALAVAAGDDPILRTMVNDNGSFQAVAGMKTYHDISNFSTFYNTAGGPTTTSFTVSFTANKGAALSTVALSHGGGNPWTLSTVQVAGSGAKSAPQIVAEITDGTGTHTISSTYQTADGTAFSFANDALTVTEPLNAGGAVTSVISFQSDRGKQQDYLDVAESASGAVVANGAAIDVATNSTAPKLIMPCSGPPKDTTPGNIPGLAMGVSPDQPPAPQPVNSPALPPAPSQAPPVTGTAVDAASSM